MTDIKRPLPGQDLQWSVNWFYGSIGGTMAMSGGVFFRDFVGPLVEPVHQACTKLAEPLGKRQTCNAEARIPRQRSDKRFLKMWTHGQWLRSGANQWALESIVQGEHHDLPWYDSSKNFLVMVNIDVKMMSWLVPYPAIGKFDIQQRITVVRKWVNHLEKYNFDATSAFNWNYAVTLAAVGSRGDLTSSIVYTTNGKSELTASITVNGIRIRGIGSTQTEEERKNWANYEEELKSTIVNRMDKTDNFTKNINEGLNGQKKFIFPGGGTFDMSDPIGG